MAVAVVVEGRGGGKARLDTDCCEGDRALEGRSTSERLAGPGLSRGEGERDLRLS